MSAAPETTAPVTPAPATTPPPATPLATPDQLSQILTAVQGISGAVTAAAGASGNAVPTIVNQPASAPSNDNTILLVGLGIAALVVALFIFKK